MLRKYISSPLFVLSCITCFSFALLGCSNSVDLQTISFEEFTLEIPETYEEVPSSLVENKQIVNKVVASYKDTASESDFDDNVIITTSRIGAELDYEQFRTVNTSKLRDQVAGYVPGNQELVNFTCNDEEIEGIFITFQVKDTLVAGIDTYYLIQYQFISNNIGYIISAASSDETSQDDWRKRITSLSCISAE